MNVLPKHPESPSSKKLSMIARLKYRRNFWPISVEIHPTGVCNHGCSWCWFDRSRERLDIGQLVELLDFLEGNGLEEIIVSGGGEPLLHPQISELLDYLRKSRTSSRTLYTNGSRLHCFEDVGSAFDYIRVSMDAGGARTYAAVHKEDPSMYAKILDQLAALDRGHRALKVGVSIVVTPSTAETLPLLVRDCSDRGIKYVVAKPLLGARFREELPPIDRGCLSSDVSLVLHGDSPSRRNPSPIPPEISSFFIMVGTDGWLYPCCHLNGEAWRISRATRSDASSEIGSTGHLAILRAYSNEVHDCTAYYLPSVT